MPSDYAPLTPNAVVDLVAFAAAADGRRDAPGKTDHMLWLAVAHANRWRADEVMTAIAEIAGTFTGEYGARILPGAVNAIVRTNRRHPAVYVPPPPVPTATERERARAIAEFVERTANRKAISAS